MKIHLLPILLCLSVVSFAGDKAPVAIAARYQIVSAMFVDADDHRSPVTIKLDSFTGETWRLSELQTTSVGRRVTIMGWSPIFENIGEGLMQTRRAVTIPEPTNTVSIPRNP